MGHHLGPKQIDRYRGVANLWRFYCMLYKPLFILYCISYYIRHYINIKHVRPHVMCAIRMCSNHNVRNYIRSHKPGADCRDKYHMTVISGTTLVIVSDTNPQN